MIWGTARYLGGASIYSFSMEGVYEVTTGKLRQALMITISTNYFHFVIDLGRRSCFPLQTPKEGRGNHS